MATNVFSEIYGGDALSEAEKQRLKAISDGIQRQRRLGAVGMMSSDEGAQGLGKVLTGQAESDAERYGKRYEADIANALDLRKQLQSASDREADRALREQAQQDLAEYRRQSLVNAQLARDAAASARSEASAAREDSRKRSETDRTRREYDTARGKLGAATAAAQNVIQLAADPNLANNPSAQTALVFAFGRMLDPTSVVREGEYKLFEQGRGLLDTLGNFSERVQTGARLTPQQIRNMAQVASSLAARQQALEQGLGSRYYKLATQRGYDPFEVTGDFDPNVSIAPGAGVQPQAPAGRAYDATGKRIR